MKLIYPLTFKMHTRILNQEEEYQFGHYSGSLYMTPSELARSRAIDQYETNPNEDDESLSNLIRGINSNGIS